MTTRVVEWLQQVVQEELRHGPLKKAADARSSETELAGVRYSETTKKYVVTWKDAEGAKRQQSFRDKAEAIAHHQKKVFE